MSAEPVSEPARRTNDDDVLTRLVTIDHRLQQISTHVAAIAQLLSPLDEVRDNLQTLTALLGTTEPITAGTAGELPGRRESAL